jgi:hypothetical protein
MGHNLHFIVVKAESGEDACLEAEYSIMGFGNENNWRTMRGAVSQDNEVYIASEGLYQPDKDSTIAKINKTIEGWMQPSFHSETTKNLLDKGKKVEDFNLQELYSLKKYADFLYQQELFKQRSGKNGDNFNVLEDSFYAYSYDEYGVTQTDMGEGKIWVVFCDMHS